MSWQPSSGFQPLRNYRQKPLGLYGGPGARGRSRISGLTPKALAALEAGGWVLGLCAFGACPEHATGLLYSPDGALPLCLLDRRRLYWHWRLRGYTPSVSLDGGNTWRESP